MVGIVEGNGKKTIPYSFKPPVRLQFRNGADTEFSYRFNRRFDLAAMLTRLGRAAVRTPPMPDRLLRLAEVHW